MSDAWARVQKIAEVCILCNDARLEWRDSKVAAVGGPTEAALVVLAEKLGVPEPALQQQIHAAHSASPPDVTPVYRHYTSRYVMWCHHVLATFSECRLAISVIFCGQLSFIFRLASTKIPPPGRALPHRSSISNRNSIAPLPPDPPFLQKLYGLSAQYPRYPLARGF